MVNRKAELLYSIVPEFNFIVYTFYFFMKISINLQKNSQEYKDAVELWDVFIATKNNLLEREGTPKEKLVLRVGKLVNFFKLIFKYHKLIELLFK